MNFNLKSFLLTWCLKVACDQIELRIGRRKFMFATVVAKLQPVSTGVIVDLKVVDAVCNLGCIRQVAQPLSVLRCIGRKIQNHSRSSPQHIDDKRANHLPNLMCKAHIIGYRFDLIRVQP